MNIAIIIRDYLLRNDHLVIPGFGTFRVIHQPAQINNDTKLLLPPSKNIVFESQQKFDDNQFMLSVKKKLGLTESETDEAIRNFLSLIDEDIRTGGKAVIEGIGEFRLDDAGILKFEQQEDLLNLTGVFALPEIEIPPHAKKEEAVVPPVKVIRPPEPVQVERKRKRKKWPIPATILVILIVLAGFAYFSGFLDQFTGTRHDTEQLKSIGKNPDRIVFGNRNSSEKDSLKENISRQLDDRTSRENALRFEEKEKKLPVTPPVVPVTSATHAGPFHIISGAFLVSANAEKHQSMLREMGFNPELLPRKGKYFMVSLGSYASQQEAANSIKKLNETLDQELWVMRLK